MDKKLKMKWVKALESGKYKQGTWFLYDWNGGYCCLGVLCSVIGVDKVKLKERQTLGELKQGHLLPSATMMKLARMNDGDKNWKGRQQSFKQIAAWIRSHL